MECDERKTFLKGVFIKLSQMMAIDFIIIQVLSIVLSRYFNFVFFLVILVFTVLGTGWVCSDGYYDTKHGSKSGWRIYTYIVSFIYILELSFIVPYKFVIPCYLFFEIMTALYCYTLYIMNKVYADTLRCIMGYLAIVICGIGTIGIGFGLFVGLDKNIVLVFAMIAISAFFIIDLRDVWCEDLSELSGVNKICGYIPYRYTDICNTLIVLTLVMRFFMDK